MHYRQLTSAAVLQSACLVSAFAFAFAPAFAFASTFSNVYSGNVTIASGTGTVTITATSTCPTGTKPTWYLYTNDPNDAKVYLAHYANATSSLPIEIYVDATGDPQVVFAGAMLNPGSQVLRLTGRNNATINYNATELCETVTTSMPIDQDHINIIGAFIIFLMSLYILIHMFRKP